MKTYPFMVMSHSLPGVERRGGQREGKKYIHKGNFMPAFRQIMGGLRALSASVDYPLPLVKKGLPWWFRCKESACNEGDPGSIPGWGRSSREENGTHSNILSWRIPWTEEPGELQSMGSQRVGHD